MIGGALEQLCGYLHQDWDLDYESVWAAVADFRANEPESLVAEARREIGKLLDQTSDEEALRRAVEGRGCYYRPQFEGLDYKEWLTRLSRELEA